MPFVPLCARNSWKKNTEQEIGYSDTSLDVVDPETLDDTTILKILQDFLIASTAKDVSLLASFQRIQEKSFPLPLSESFQVIELMGRWFRYRISIIDLDVKKHSKIPYYHRYDQEIVENFLRGRNGT